MSPSDDDITDEDIANSPFHGKATARIAQESGDTVRFQEGERWDPFVNGRGMPVTSVMIMSTAMLQAVNIELFELGMWQAWSGG